MTDTTRAAAARKKAVKKKTARKKKTAAKKQLVIVESPSKARTINRYLGNRYVVAASMGHIIDLPKSRMAIDFENNFEPEYKLVRGKGKILNELKKLAKSSSRIYLAPDPDREGEAISWHLKNVLSQVNEEIYRIEFNEITESAVAESLEHPRDIDMSLVNAQQARRLLDRIVGYTLSPILWEKVKKGLSAGRVQSVALRAICEREAEIGKFEAREYWTIEITFSHDGQSYTAELKKIAGQDADLQHEKAAGAFIEKMKSGRYVVKEIVERKKFRNCTPPFITSKLQQAASQQLKFSPDKTMLIAQGLYEGVAVKNVGRVGLITYMRTDSVRVSNEALGKARGYIKNEFGDDYVPETPNIYRVGKKAQDAHEAIRPTMVELTPDSIKDSLSRDQYKLYSLIWTKFIASQMTKAETLQTSIDIENQDALFRISGTKIVFDGFLKVMNWDNEKKEGRVPHVETGEEIKVSAILPEQHFTQPPPRYNNASLIKYLEESGIGRPSTYASIVATLRKRYYIQPERGGFKPTVLGDLANRLLVANFPSIIEEKFTAALEVQLDEVADEKLPWKTVLHDFYESFHKSVEEAHEKIESYKGVLDEATDMTCEKCGKPIIKKLGRHGFFLACSGFPDCRNTMPLIVAKCPRPGCGGNIVKKRGSKRRPNFYGCTKYPDCDFILTDEPLEEKCPECGNALVLKRNRNAGDKKLCIDTACGYVQEAKP